MKNLFAEITARFSTLNGNYIGIGYVSPGSYLALWFNQDLQAIAPASSEDWFWASTWGAPLQHGNWRVEVPTLAHPRYTNFDLMVETFERPNITFNEDSLEKELDPALFQPLGWDILLNPTTLTFEYAANRSHLEGGEVEVEMHFLRSEGNLHVFSTPYGEVTEEFTAY